MKGVCRCQAVSNGCASNFCTAKGFSLHLIEAPMDSSIGQQIPNPPKWVKIPVMTSITPLMGFRTPLPMDSSIGAV